MRIKQLILNGFKSFSEKTVISFDPTINAIVGPNGCGKSNILDGLRWVMGEASFTEMRCAKTEDLIFAGNKFIPPVNYAEVVLILETTEHDKFYTPGLANLGSEIEIRRRYFRSGESEFFINKKPCKLKDIQDLFTSGGGSGKAYSIFDLPTMRRIISDNLKELFIEASGLAFYHERKAEIERKLKQTQDDLARLRDIISERMRITRNLKRQAYRLLAFEKVKAEEQKLQIALLRFDYQKVLDAENQLVAELNRVNTELQELENRFKVGEQRKAELKKVLEEKEAEQNELTNEITNLKGQLIVYEERLKSNLEKQNFYQAELKKIQTELELPLSVDITPQTIDEKKTYLSQIKELYQKKEEEFERLRTSNKELEAEIFTIQLQLDELENQERELYLQLAKLDSEIKNYEEKLNNNQRYLQALEKSYESIKLSTGSEVFFADLSQKTIGVITDYYGDNLVGLLSQMLEVPEDYRLALKSALWGHEPMVVIKELQNISDYPSMLKQPVLIAAGESSQDDPEVMFTDTLPQELKRYRKLREVVTIKGPLAACVKTILENTFVVEDINEILELHIKYPQYSYTHRSGVTLRNDGVLVIVPNPQDFVSAEIDKKLESLKKEFEILNDENQKILNTLKELNQEKDKLTQKKDELNREIASAKQNLAQKRELNKQNLELASNFLLDLHKRREEITKLQSELEHLGIEITSHESKKKTLSGTQKNLTETLTNLKTEEENLRRQIDELKAELTTKQKIFQESDYGILVAEYDRLEQELNELRILLDLKTKEAASKEIDKLKIDQNREYLETQADSLMPQGRELLKALVNTKTIDEIKKELGGVQKKLAAIGLINPLAKDEYEREKHELEKLQKQENDIVQAQENLMQALEELTARADAMFSDTYQKVRESFKRIFKEIFLEGEADLVLATPNDPLESDIKVIAQPKGKTPRRLDQLSDGEKALLALSLLFAFYDTKPAPFVFMDEVDAPLDDANVKRFTEYLKRLSETTQVIIITHNKITIEAASVVIGVTSERAGTSKIVSVRLTDLAALSQKKTAVAN
ncbi:MAG: AAA family ATPase [candidate division WOR-3 bacterium]